jgi:RNA polymerase sigma-70 factor (ECF subfamily)
VAPSRLESGSDAELLACVASGSDAAEAFGIFYRRHEALVVGYLRRRVPRADLAADLAAETFAVALRAAARFDVEQSRDDQAAGWLLTIAHRQLLASLRRGRVADDTRRRLAMTEPLVLIDESLARVDELASLPENLESLVASLPHDVRVAVLARVVDERPYEEIAAEMDCSQLVVRQRVSRGLARLRHQLSEDSA